MSRTPEAARYYITGTPVRCPNCGCCLEAYEVFACRLRGLETPVCLGCLADALVWLRKYLLPMLETALKMLGGEEPVPDKAEIKGW